MTIERHLSSAEIVERIDKHLSALVWENFLKLPANGDKEDQARHYLDQKLQDYLTHQPAEFHAPLLQTPEEDRAELNAFLKEKLKPKKSKIWPLLRQSPFQKEIDADKDARAEILELRRAYREKTEKISATIDSAQELFQQWEEAKDLIHPLINQLPFTPDGYQLEAQFTALAKNARSWRRKLINLTGEFAAMNFMADDDLRHSDSGRKINKEAEKMLKKLDEINKAANGLVDELEQINAKLQAMARETSQNK